VKKELERGHGTEAAAAAPDPARAGLVYHGKLQQKAPHRGAFSVLAEHAINNGDSPVIRAEIYRRDVVLRKDFKGKPPKGGKPPGSVITEFTDESLRAGLFVVKNCDCDFWSMMTLTYPAEFPCNGQLVKYHLEDFRRHYLKRYQRRGFWFLEFQRRGAPHFHILSEVDLQECGDLVLKRRKGKWNRGADSYLTCPSEEDWLADRWYRVVGSGDPKHLLAGVSWEAVEKTEGAIRYMATHGAKRSQKKVPSDYQNVGRPWGRIGKIRVDRDGIATVNSEEVFQAYGQDALSSRGRVKKYLYDAAGKFTFDEYAGLY